ncbi:MAG: hypothetical protein KA143_01405, partial [Saprospiraceae bacterium]|nr:hypothetical protein [Saprospiraceae bacterium]
CFNCWVVMICLLAKIGVLEYKNQSGHPPYKEKFLVNTRNQWMPLRTKDAVSNPHSAFVVRYSIFLRLRLSLRLVFLFLRLP